MAAHVKHILAKLGAGAELRQVYAGPGATVLMRTGVACRPTVGARITNSLDAVSRAVAPSQDGEQTADYLGMQGLLASVISVVGTLLGSTVTYVFQRVNAGASRDSLATSDCARSE